jgi:hypothetical protein
MTYAIRTFALLLVVGTMLAGFACGTQAPEQPVVEACPSEGGPPSRVTVRCKLLRAADEGRIPRRISSVEADRLLDQIERLNVLRYDFRDGRASKEQVLAEFENVERLSLELTGLTFTELSSLTVR